jgi:poly [ADP-ribose] polymerase
VEAAPTSKRGKAAKSSKPAAIEIQDDPSSSSTTVSSVVEAKSVTMVRKGRAAVDPDCPIAPSTHVFEDLHTGAIYDVLLNQVDIVNNHNKYYIIQMLQGDANPNQWHVWTKWGRVGKIAGSDCKSCPSRAQAEEIFCNKFYDKTKQDWSSRDNFQPVKGKYTLLKRDYFAEVSLHFGLKFFASCIMSAL